MSEDVGSIKENHDRHAVGRVAYAVLSVGGFLGMGDRLFAFPGTLIVDEDRKCFIVHVDKGRLENAPGLSRTGRTEPIPRGATECAGIGPAAATME
jgi:hypothetical protein